MAKHNRNKKRKRHPKDKHYLENTIVDAEKHCPDNTAIIIITQQFGDSAQAAQYVANCNREDAIKALKAFLYRIGEKEDWMTHIK